MNPFTTALVYFWYTILIIIILGRFLYLPNRGRKEYLFTYILMAAIVFLLCALIRKVDLGLGFAIGIFAIFGIIRYRTTPILPREMTYIFLCAGIAAKNSLLPLNFEFYKLLVTDVSIILLVAILEYTLFRKKISTKTILYNNTALILPERREELEKDLADKFGLKNIEKIKMGKIDTIKETVRLMVFLRDDEDNHFEE